MSPSLFDPPQEESALVNPMLVPGDFLRACASAKTAIADMEAEEDPLADVVNLEEHRRKRSEDGDAAHEPTA